MKLVIYGAKSLALGVHFALKYLYPEYPVQCFLVTSKKNNPATLAGLPVKEVEAFSREERGEDVHVLVGTPEDVHPQIIEQLKKYNFLQYTCIDSRREVKLMERYFEKIGKFPSFHALTHFSEGNKVNLQIFMVKFHKDRKLTKAYKSPAWCRAIQVGAALTMERVAEITDAAGENISAKNVNYCELTALYWIWKNKLSDVEASPFLVEVQKQQDVHDSQVLHKAEYYGLFHYRRILDIREDELESFKENSVDVLLPFPMLHEPDILEHHRRYLKEEDWEAMMRALWELQPDYAAACKEIFGQEYFYNYNLIVAKRQVLCDYCAWLFPILKRIEELSNPKGWERADRYIGYLGENLLTLYFFYHQHDLKIYHTGRIMLT